MSVEIAFLFKSVEMGTPAPDHNCTEAHVPLFSFDQDSESVENRNMEHRSRDIESMERTDFSSSD